MSNQNEQGVKDHLSQHRFKTFFIPNGLMDTQIRSTNSVQTRIQLTTIHQQARKVPLPNKAKER